MDTGTPGKVDVILGLQWGDEGKGKIVDTLAPHYQIICRFQGGPNAGHTLVFDGKKFILHTIPSGIFRPRQINLIGNGVVIDPVTFGKEIQLLQMENVSYEERLLISQKAHLILPTHRLLDLGSEASKGKDKIGSTLKGIGPTYMDKTGRNGMRVGDLLSDNFTSRYDKLKEKHLKLSSLYPEVDFDLEVEEEKWFSNLDYITDLQLVNGEYFLQEALQNGARVLAEGAQGSMLDIDFGTYPYVTSSNTLSAGVCTGTGVPPSKIGEVIGITKAYCTRVGSGPFPTELSDATGEKLRGEGKEFGATTGRPRRCGWLDIPQLKYTCMLNGVTELVMTKLDVLNNFKKIEFAENYVIDGKVTDKLPFDLCDEEVELQWHTISGWNKELPKGGEYEHLPEELLHYVNTIEEILSIPITMISTGPERKNIYYRQVSV